MDSLFGKKKTRTFSQPSRERKKNTVPDCISISGWAIRKLHS
jgi:hypothetical protein